MTPQEFVAKWRGNTSSERQVAQQHFLDLCALVGHQTPAALDPQNKFFTFEAGAAKQGGGQGWADVWYRGHFAIEYKGPSGSMEKAYSQLLQYRESLENPPLLVVSNIQTITIHSNFTNSVKRTLTLTLDDLLTAQGLTHLRNIFYNPEAFRPEKTAAQVTEEAAAHFARLADHLRKWGDQSHAIAHYLIRLLFCLFAEDIDLLPRDLFTRLVEQGRRNPALFNRQVRQLFQAMAEGAFFGEHEIRYFDGGLFDDDTAIEMDSEGIVLLHGITQLDWSAIEPAILGTLFTRSLDPAQRAKLGAQYTSREDILLIVEPVLMAPLRREWQHVKQAATELAARRDSAATRGQRTRLANELDELMSGFAHRLARTRVLDPACGSGNFLYIALRLLLDLWKETSLFAGELGLSLPLPLPGLAPSPEQLYGIEVNDYAHELAQATVWIGYLQWLHENGYSFTAEPILKPLDTIKLMDAILAYDADGKPVEPVWPEAEVIVGNPPFLGAARMRTEFGSSYVEHLTTLYGDRLPACDLVCYWFEKSREQIESNKAWRAGLLATQAIRGGANRTVMDKIKRTGDIFWAQSDRDWVLDGAVVHVSMVGFDSGSEELKTLNGSNVNIINADLTSTVDITKAKQLDENRGLSFKGCEPGGPFDIDPDVAKVFLDAPPNANGRPNSDVIRPVINASDLMGSSRGMYTIDFAMLDEHDAACYEQPFEYVKRVVYPVRKDNREAIRAKFWWRYARPRPEMREAIKALPRYITTPGVSKHRVFVWVDNSVICNNLLCVIALVDDYHLGVLQSRQHEVWSRGQGTQLREAESGQRYTSTVTFETFPFPWPPGQEPAGDARVEAIAAAAKELVELRDAWLNPPDLSEKELQKRTLTNLYNQRPNWLAQAHHRLDTAVCSAYGWPDDLADEEILARLLALNLQRAKGESGGNE